MKTYDKGNREIGNEGISATSLLPCYVNSLKYLDWLCVFGIKEGLERIKELTASLGEPQNFYRTIHVAGTNGKGSVCAMLAEMLKAQGLRVGLFTSPHLESYCERIKINGENISENDFAEMIFRVKDCNVVATHFEVLTAAAFEYFKERAVDIAVIEVGLGGTFDSTNIITPELSVITNVALDHENILGDLENIARNKAGIIKENVPVVTGATGLPLEIIREVAKDKNSPLYEVNPLKLKSPSLMLNLRGEYQKFNAAIAIKAAELLKLDDAAIEKGLAQVKWAGRFEVIKNSAGVFIIDGAHNPHGAKALRDSLDKNFPNGKRIWVFGALRDKNFAEMIKILFRADDFVIVTPPNSERAATTEILCKTLHENDIPCAAVENNLEAIERLKNSAGDVKIIAGSLYLIGNVRRKIFDN
ncbi:MAG: bifunctional folylpolyglutamate synthase/dihydrofolate synthase [Selenomonadaceae bacterium]|nr:bifunctional folylpolyglutamate synthase/dihydrofolate synthase [Selenomonadaceae bacterium]